jgi:DNA-directed RNA polymerase subunit beta'
MEDIVVPQGKERAILQAEKQLAEVDRQYRRGLITESERRAQAIGLWSKVKEQIEEEMIAEYDPENPIYLTVKSGARGSFAQITQLGGMIGLVVNPTGQIIELPVVSNYKDGLSVIEYFNSTHGARKGKSDTSLRTSDAGYLTRRLVDVAQDIVISQADCQTEDGLLISQEESAVMGQRFTDRMVGRFLADDVKVKNKILAKKGEEINRNLANILDQSGVHEVSVRSPLFCQADWGVCQKCYGWDLSKNELIKIGEVVGIVAAQAIGEPGTQLTMKTFHLGGVHGEDITSGLPRVEELFEARSPRTPALLAEIPGTVSLRDEKDSTIITITADQLEEKTYTLPEGYKPTVGDREIVRPRQAIGVAAEKKAIRTEIGGRASVRGGKIVITALEKATRHYEIPKQVTLKVKSGEKVSLGRELTEGHLDLDLSLKWKGRLSTMKYIIAGVQEIYQSQGQTINDKHIEIIVSRMFSKVRILEAGDSQLLSGGAEDRRIVEKINKGLTQAKKKPVVFEDTVLGITRIALKTDSFLSAASFQETTGVLIDAGVKGATDYLKGLKENVIIGKLIPAGTAFRKPRVL